MEAVPRKPEEKSYVRGTRKMGTDFERLHDHNALKAKMKREAEDAMHTSLKTVVHASLLTGFGVPTP